jgi:hypothetical protein
MKAIFLIVCVVSFSLCWQKHQCWASEKPVFVSEEKNPPKALKPFWNGIQSNWLPRSENEFWTEDQRAKVLAYCKQYARNNNPDEIVPELIKDLKSRESEVRAFIYTWIIINWEPQRVKALLQPYYLGSDPVEKRIAADFLAEVEQL